MQISVGTRDDHGCGSVHLQRMSETEGSAPRDAVNLPHKPPSWSRRPDRIDKPLLRFLGLQITAVGYLKVTAKKARP
jgi:hypothetical protein